MSLNQAKVFVIHQCYSSQCYKSFERTCFLFSFFEDRHSIQTSLLSFINSTTFYMHLRKSVVFNNLNVFYRSKIRGISEFIKYVMLVDMQIAHEHDDYIVVFHENAWMNYLQTTGFIEHNIQTSAYALSSFPFSSYHK